MTDIELLRCYTLRRSEEAFSTLVARHVNMVYSVALRKTGHADAAEEVTQAVFIILARKAERLREGTVLCGWLYQTARHASASFLRGESRRMRRDGEACMQSFSNEPEHSVWLEIEPLLEDAMGRLGEKERDALALRFFERKNFQEIATVLGVSENAAKKRVGHGLEKLRKFLLKRGVPSTAVIIGAAISTHSVQAAPAVLTKSITALAITNGVATSSSTLTVIKGALKIMAWTKVKTTVVATAIVAAVGITTVAIRHEPEPKPKPPVTLERSAFAFAGYKTPEATLETLAWALSNGDSKAFLACCAPEERARHEKHFKGKSEAALVAEGKQQLDKVTGLKVQEQKTIPDGRVVLVVQFEGAGRTQDMPFKKIGDEWKLAR